MWIQATDYPGAQNYGPPKTLSLVTHVLSGLLTYNRSSIF